MNSGKLATLLFLIVTMSSLCRADLLPGDIALTRIQGNVISLMALRSIPGNEEIRVTDRNWVNGSFNEATGSAGVIDLPSGGLEAGKQHLVDLSNFGIELDWKKTLHFFQRVATPDGEGTRLRHLLVVELNREGLRWQTNIPDGLIRDVTHITIREQFEGHGMDHLIKQSLLTQELTPLQWMRAIGSFRAWTFAEDYSFSPGLSFWLELKLTVSPSPGIITLPLQAQNYSSTEGQLFVPVRRSFGSAGGTAVELRATGQIAPFQTWRNETDSRYNHDLTDVAYGPEVGFVAVSPNSGLIMVNESGNWEARETNEDPGANLQLTSIMHDGSAFYACAIKGDIYKSADGINWALLREGQTGEQFTRIHHLKGTEFPYVALGRNGLAAFSTDGSNWNLAEIPGSPDLFGATFFGGRYVLCGSGGTILSANSPGGSWSNSTTPNSRDLYGIAPVELGSITLLLAVGQHGTMISTANLENPFVGRQSNTRQSLFDILVANRNGGTNKYVFAVGANGVTVSSTNGSAFRTSKFDPRAPALYALAQDETGKEPVIYGVGEYGSLTRFNPDSTSLSGSISGVDLDGQGNSLELTWANGESGQKVVKLTKGASLSQFRERIRLNLERPTESGAPYRLGNGESEINFFRSPNSNTPPVADNYGPLLNLTGAQLEVISDAEWRLRFRIYNTSRLASKRLFIRFEGTNLPDFTIPADATQQPGSAIGPLERSDVISSILYQPVESIALYEEYLSGEVVLKAQTAINSLVANPQWEPNGIFERSLGAYLKDAGSLNNPGIPGLGILGGTGQEPAQESAIETSGSPQPEIAAEALFEGGSGFVFSGAAPTPPDNNPEASELVLLGVNIDDSLISMPVRETYDFFMVGDFYNTGTGLVEQYTMNTVDWDVTESSQPAAGLSIENDSGTFESTAYPGAAYPRAVSIDAVTTEGAPLDGEGNPVEYNDSQGLSITEPASYTTYAEWVAANSLTGDDALEGADPDEDGIVNLLEFVLGMDPNTANVMSGTSSSYDANRSEFTFSFTIPKELSAVTMKIMTSADMSTWTEREATMTASDSTTETWSATVSMGASGFGSLQAETYTP